MPCVYRCAIVAPLHVAETLASSRQRVLAPCIVYVMFVQDTNKVLAISRIMVAWQPVGVCMGVYDMCLRYLKQRQQFGAPLASFQVTTAILNTSPGLSLALLDI